VRAANAVAAGFAEDFDEEAPKPASRRNGADRSHSTIPLAARNR
jgi:hypothetical protein